MADTLAEIYRNTLTESSFDSNGEATIVTTNSSTAHVIKNIQAEDTDANVKVNGTLQVNDFDIVGLTASSSGSEIIAPSSTVKVKSTGIPLQYEDIEFNTRRSATQYVTATQAKVNGYLAIPYIFVSNNTSGMSLSEDSTENVFAPNIGSNNYHYNAQNNFGSTTSANVYNNSGTQQFAHNDNYTPKWFDGKQYAYYYGARSGSSGNGINRIDIAAATSSRLLATSISAPSSDPKMFGVNDANNNTEYLFFWSEKNDGNGGQVYNVANNSVTAFTNGNPQSVYGSSQTDNRNWYAIKRTNGSYRFVIPVSSTEIRYYDWNVGDVHTSSISYTQMNLSGNTVRFHTNTARHSVFGTKLFYLNNDSAKVAAIDFDPDTPTTSANHSVIGSNAHYTTYGVDLTLVIRTPSNSTVSARSYGISPSLKLRVTGVTST
jgi:hypothetical protein